MMMDIKEQTIYFCIYATGHVQTQIWSLLYKWSILSDSFTLFQKCLWVRKILTSGQCWSHSKCWVFLFFQHVDQWNQFSFQWSVKCVMWWKEVSSHCVFMFQGGQLTEQESPVSFPYRLYRCMRNAEVINQSINHQLCQPIRKLDFSPDSLPLQVESQLVFIRDSLELISDLYLHNNCSSVTWDTDKTEHFLMSIHRQTDGLKACVSRQTDRQTDTSTPLRTYTSSDT